jgi:hypothetical protein
MMKKFLIRASFDPYKQYEAKDFILNSHAGANSGNLMFAYGVMNALTTNDTAIDYTYKHYWSEKDAAEINEKYDAFILPMADAFREDFAPKLDEYTKVIKHLKIPVIVIGIGLRAKIDEDPTLNHPFDDSAYHFVKEVLNHSSLIGLRGRNTGKYLTKMGFQEGRDFTPIGCPSLYTYGAGITTKIPEKVENMVINTNTLASREVSDFIINSAKKANDYWLVQQKYYEMRDMYVGNHTFIGRKTVENVFDKETFRSLNQKDRIRYFFNVPEWIEFMKDKDLFLGNRFHGSVAAILSGTPHVFIPFDARTKELIDYHHITALEQNMTVGNKTIFDYLDCLDFKSFEKHHKENFLHYLDFLERNGLHHIFTDKKTYAMGESPMEKLMSPQPASILHCIQSLSKVEQFKRIVCTDALIGKVSIRKFMDKA